MMTLPHPLASSSTHKALADSGWYSLRSATQGAAVRTVNVIVFKHPMRAQRRSLLRALIGFFFQCNAAFCTVVVQFAINASSFRTYLAHFKKTFRHEKSTMQICTVLYFGFMVEPRGIEDTLVCTPSSRSASERHRRSDQMGSISLCFVPLIKIHPWGVDFSLVEPRGIEPLSESNLERASPGAVCYLHSLIPARANTLRESVAS